MSTTKKYTIKFQFNGNVLTKRTDDIKETIAEVAPQILLTDVFVTAKKTGDKAVSERHLSLTQGKRMFRDEVAREVFVNNLLLA